MFKALRSEHTGNAPLCAAVFTGEASIPERKKILAQKRQALVEQIAQLQGAVAYVDQKQAFYEDVLAGKRPYVSNLLPQE